MRDEKIVIQIHSRSYASAGNCQPPPRFTHGKGPALSLCAYSCTVAPRIEILPLRSPVTYANHSSLPLYLPAVHAEHGVLWLFCFVIIKELCLYYQVFKLHNVTTSSFQLNVLFALRCLAPSPARFLQQHFCGDRSITTVVNAPELGVCRHELPISTPTFLQSKCL